MNVKFEDLEDWAIKINYILFQLGEYWLGETDAPYSNLVSLRETIKKSRVRVG